MPLATLRTLIEVFTCRWCGRIYSDWNCAHLCADCWNECLTPGAEEGYKQMKHDKHDLEIEAWKRKQNKGSQNGGAR